jgi:hypothetical protein
MADFAEATCPITLPSGPQSAPLCGCRTQDSPFPPPPPPPFPHTRARAPMEMLKGRAKAVEGSFFKAETDAALLQHARTLPVSQLPTPTLSTPPPPPSCP